MVIGGIQNGMNFQQKTFITNLETSSAWTNGPSLKIGRNGHKAWRLKKNCLSNVYCTIVVGGIGTPYYITQTEILCDDSSSWEFGPELPHPVTATYMVEYPDGEGVLLVGGNGNSTTLNTIYYLKDCSSAWYRFDSTLMPERYGHVAQLMPCSVFGC